MINIIAAVSANGVIGANGCIPWDIPEDSAYFRKLTVGNICIMGRRTYESIGFPLPKRFCIVVSRTKKYSGDMLTTAESLPKALEEAEKYIAEKEQSLEIFICGGEKIYHEGLQYAQRLYLTELETDYSGDTFFPQFDTEKFRLVSRTHNSSLHLNYSVYLRQHSTKHV